MESQSNSVITRCVWCWRSNFRNYHLEYQLFDDSTNQLWPAMRDDGITVRITRPNIHLPLVWMSCYVWLPTVYSKSIILPAATVFQVHHPVWISTQFLSHVKVRNYRGLVPAAVHNNDSFKIIRFLLQWTSTLHSHWWIVFFSMFFDPIIYQRPSNLSRYFFPRHFRVPYPMIVVFIHHCWGQRHCAILSKVRARTHNCVLLSLNRSETNRNLPRHTPQETSRWSSSLHHRFSSTTQRYGAWLMKRLHLLKTHLTSTSNTLHFNPKKGGGGMYTERWSHNDILEKGGMLCNTDIFRDANIK